MIKVFCGAMYSGKSTSLVREMVKMTYAKKRILFIRPKMDTRGYVTHSEYDGKLYELVNNDKIDTLIVEEFDGENTDDIREEKYDAIFIDEYFMIKNNRVLLENLLINKENTDVYFGGLIADSNAVMFKEAVDILPLCDEIEKLNGVCTVCGSMLGNYSCYKGKPLFSIEVGDDKYECMCGKCYFEKNL